MLPFESTYPPLLRRWRHVGTEHPINGSGLGGGGEWTARNGGAMTTRGLWGLRGPRVYHVSRELMRLLFVYVDVMVIEIVVEVALWLVLVQKQVFVVSCPRINLETLIL